MSTQEMEKKTLGILMKNSFSVRRLSILRLLHQLECTEDVFFDLLILLYTHKKVLGKIEGKDFFFENYFPDDIPPPEVIIGRQLTTLQLQLLEDPPISPFAGTSFKRKVTPAIKTIESPIKASHPSNASEGSNEIDLMQVEMTPVYRNYQLILKLLLNNRYHSSISDLKIKISIPKGVRYFRCEQIDLAIESDRDKIEFDLDVLQVDQAINLDFVFNIQDIGMIIFTGIIRYKNPEKTLRMKKIPETVIPFNKLPEFKPKTHPSFEIERFLNRGDLHSGSRFFALPPRMDAILVHNYLKDIAKRFNFNLCHEEVQDQTFRGFNFAEIDQKSAKENSSITENITCLITQIDKGMMGLTMHAKDPQIISVTLTFAMKELSKRFTLGGSLGGELLEMICSDCGMTMPEYFGTGMKHFCVNCGKVNIYY